MIDDEVSALMESLASNSFGTWELILPVKKFEN
jgi:hypothetical protein